MKKEFGAALREFLRNRDYSEASSDLKKLYGESRGWDSFISEAKGCGFNWSQIYFVKEIMELYGCIEDINLKWFILHIQHQYEAGNLRTSLLTLKEDIDIWLPEERAPFSSSELVSIVPELIKNNSALFGEEGEPLLLIGDYIYINRIKKYEERFLNLLDIRLKTGRDVEFNLDSVLSHLEEGSLYALDSSRKDVVKKALKSNFLIISGGPGTGKTTTVVTLIKALRFSGFNNIALAAPTGRAAKRMIESIVDDVDIEAFTLHKLLGIIPNRNKPRYNSERLLPCDAVIVDEASMVDIHMMYRLFDALSPETKLILVGDKDQLPSVEAGALLGDFLYRYREPSHKMRDNIVVLEKSYRSSDGIMDVAKKVISGDYKSVLEELNVSDDVTLKDLPEIDRLIEELSKKYLPGNLSRRFDCSVTEYNSVIDQIDGYFRLFSSFTVLTPSKKGLYGTYSLNSRIKKVFNPSGAAFYHGEPVMITKNDYINGLFNGDRGVVFRFNNGLYAFFKEITGYKIKSISRIADYETSYAGTVHKSQGSEFSSVAIVIPEGSDKMLTREILYTAITRAKERVLIISGESEIQTAVSATVRRESGIRDFLLD